MHSWTLIMVLGEPKYLLSGFLIGGSQKRPMRIVIRYYGSAARPRGSRGQRRRPAEKQHVAAPAMWTRCCGDDTQSRSLACVYAHLTTGEPRSAASAASWGRSRAQLVLSRVPGPPTGVTRLGSPASPRMVPVDAAACRAYRDPRTRNHSQVHSCSCVCTHVTMRAARSCPSGGL